MDAGFVVLGLAIIFVVGVVLWKALSTGTESSANFSLAKLFQVEIQLGSAEKDAAKLAVESAADSRGSSVTGAAGEEIDRRLTVRLTRLLWVDDHPDNNRYETVALEELGFLVTSATSTSAGVFYRDRLDFSVAITDLGRDTDYRAGITFIRRVHDVDPQLPVIVYTVDAERKRDEVLAAGAYEVVDDPEALVLAVLAARESPGRINGPVQPSK